VDLAVDDPAVVIEDVVDVGVPELGVVVLVLGLARGCCPVAIALSSADVAPVAAVRDVPELLDVHVDKRSRVRVLVAADRFTGPPVDVPELVHAAADQHRMHGREGGIPSFPAIATGPRRLRQRRCKILRTLGYGVLRGLRSGRLERSWSWLLWTGTGWACCRSRYRSAQRFAVGHETR